MEGRVHEDQPAVEAPAPASAPATAAAPPGVGVRGPGEAGLSDASLAPAIRRALGASVARASGNAVLARALRAGAVGLARSPQSEQLTQTWSTAGKGALFERLRALGGTNPPDHDTKELIDGKLVGDDQWLALNLLMYGREASWPIDLRVRREMKGWGESGGKGAVFEILRVDGGAHAGDAALSAAIAAVFAAGTEDLWLAQNLQAHGREASWPIDLRVEREMKGWGDSGGKGAVFDILRAAGGLGFSNVALNTVIMRQFAVGTEDRVLARNLMVFGPEASWPAPVVASSGFVPFDNAPLASPGERIIFNGAYTYAALPGEDYHELVFTASAGAFDTAAGSSTKTIVGLVSGNVDFFIPAAFTASSSVTVTVDVRTRSTHTVATSLSWTFRLKTNPPTTITQVEGDGPVALGSTYHYNVGPNRGAPGGPDYEHQTILERFGTPTCNIAVSELTPAFRAANPSLTTPEAINAHFFGDSGDNGTFVVDSSDQIIDLHGGIGPHGADTARLLREALITNKDVVNELPQVYEAEPGVTLGEYLIRRIVKADGSYSLRKKRK